MSGFIFEVKDLSHKHIEGDMNNISFGLRFKEVHALIIKNNVEQLTFIESILSKNKDTLIFNSKDYGYANDIKDIDIIYRDPILMDNLSVAENIYFDKLPLIKGTFFVNWKKLSKNAHMVLNKFGIDIDSKQQVKFLSTESKKLIYIAKILHNNPKIVIMQEPMEYLSPKNAIKVNRIIKNYTDNGGSIIYITKQWEEALSISNWITIISKGEVAGRMSADEAKRNPKKLISIIEGYHYKEDDDKDSNNVLNAVLKSAEFLTSEYELKDILLLLAKELTEVMEAGGCSIYLIDSRTNTIIDDFLYSKNMADSPLLKKELILNIASQKDIYYSNLNDTEFQSMFDKPVDIKTLISIPILIRTQLSGLINIYYNEIYTQTEEESMYLFTFARHAAIAIEDTRLMGRSVLLQESHHRIKNNLQSIISLIMMQKDYIEVGNSKSINDVFNRIISSIKSLASVHDLLSKNEHGGSIINLKEIIEAIIKTMRFTNMNFNIDLEDVFISYNKATSIAIIVNELLTNCQEHAFIGFSKNYNRTIDIYLEVEKDDVILKVKDNGIGIPESFDIKKLDTVGVSVLIGIIKNEFQGEISFIRDNGTIVTVILPRKWMI